jgi:hypothetical protein
MEPFMELSGSKTQVRVDVTDRKSRILSALRAYENSSWGRATENSDQAAGLCKRASLVFWSQCLEEFEASRPQFEVQVRIHREAIAELQRVLAPRDQAALTAAAAAADDGGEWLTITVPFERPEHAHRDLLALGDRVEVLGPAKLRERIAASARTLAALYAAGSRA